MSEAKSDEASDHPLACESYLLRTWHASTRPDALGLARETVTRWLGLRILRVAAGNAVDAEGLVEFVARYKVHGRAERLHEISRFKREDGQWFYLSGEIVAPLRSL